jgi:hypothetical protein
MSRRMLQSVSFLGIANFVVFFIAAVYLGGDALNGRIIDGHYFLASHGRLTEVKQAVFVYSEWHARSLFVTHPLALLCGWLSNRHSKNPD